MNNNANTYRFDEIVNNVTEKRIPTSNDKDTYIGLEHLVTGCLHIRSWGSPVDITGEKLVMKKGDILFGRRNAYLRRAAIAPIDGLFSAHGMIFRPQKRVILDEFLPYFIISDKFMDKAIEISVGSLSPTVNWKTLREIKFYIPTLDKQEKIVPVFQAMTDLIEKYKVAIKQVDELVKSQFIEMFGESNNHEKLGDVCDVRKGTSITREQTQNGSIPVVAGGQTPSCYHNTANRFGNTVTISASGAYAGYLAYWEEPIFASDCNTINAKNEAIISTKFVFYMLKTRQNEIYGLQKGTGQPHVYGSELERMNIVVPTQSEQMTFMSLAQQTDKLKFYLANEWKNVVRYCIIKTLGVA